MAKEVIRSVCPRDCPDVCGMLTTVEEGRVIRVQGDPEHPITQGYLCGRFQHYEELIYHPDRVLHPMVKTANGHAQISWDNALNLLCEKFTSILAEHGGDAILPYHYLGHMGIISTRFPDRLWNKMNVARVGGEICAMAGIETMIRVVGQVRGTEPRHLDKTQMYIAWGKNPKETNMHGWRFTKDIHPMVVVDPYTSDSARAADMHIQPRPGTDSALAMGVGRCLVEDDAVDWDFVAKFTTGFDAVRDAVMAMSLDEVAEITGVPAAQIRAFAALYAGHRPSLIHLGVGLQRNFNGGEMIAAISLLAAMTGQIGTAGGGVLYANYDWQLNDISHPELRTEGPVMHNMVHLGRDLTENADLKALYIYNQNPAATVPNQNLVRRGLARDDLFVVAHDLYMTDTMQLADLCLPACSFAETPDLHLSYWHDYVNVNQQAIEPVGEARSNYWVTREVARGMGYTEPCFYESEEDVMLDALRGTGLELEELKHKPVLWGDPDGTTFDNRVFPTPSGKIELIAPTFSPDARSAPYRLITPKTHHLQASQVFNLPRKFRAVKDPWVFIHPDDARKEGISTGDPVSLSNRRGAVNLIAYVSDRTQSGVLVSYMVRWGANANAVTTDQLADVAGNSAFHSSYVNIERLTNSDV